MLLDQIDGLTRQIDILTTRIETQIAAVPAAAPTLAQGWPGQPLPQGSTRRGRP
jgi:hypothetical protein